MSQQYLPDGSPIVDSVEKHSSPGCMTAIVSFIFFAILILVIDFILKLIGAPFYLIPFPRI